MPKPEYASRQELREDIGGLRELIEQHRAEFREMLREELAPLTAKIGEQNGRVRKVEEWQRIRSQIERAVTIAIGAIWTIAGGFAVWWVQRYWSALP